MTLQHVVEEYATFRKTLGERFRVNGQVLKAFCKAMGHGIALADVAPERVSSFLMGVGPLTASWHVKHNALVGFYRYAISRGFVAHSPLPLVVPKRPPAFQPYIYSPAELHHLIDATDSYQRNRGLLEPSAVKTILLLMYAAALRTSEVLSLTIADVDLSNALLMVRESKFFKSRLVPLGPKTTQALSGYANGRREFVHSREGDSPFFVGRNGKKINMDTFRGAFQKLRDHAGLRRAGGPRCQPRLHDLRHTSAVHRLTAWYSEGKDVQLLLPQLSIYLAELALLVGNRGNTGHVFLNRCGQPITRFGIHTMVERYAQKISPHMPSLKNKRVSPHTIRHTTATHLLRAGVDINTIRAWLGHVSLNTTNVYAEVDLEMKAKALATCEIKAEKVPKHWREDAGLLRFLQSL